MIQKAAVDLQADINLAAIRLETTVPSARNFKLVQAPNEDEMVPLILQDDVTLPHECFMAAWCT